MGDACEARDAYCYSRTPDLTQTNVNFAYPFFHTFVHANPDIEYTFDKVFQCLSVQPVLCGPVYLVFAYFQIDNELT